MIDLNLIKSRASLPLALSAAGATLGVELGVYKGAFSQCILDAWMGSLIGVDSYNQGSEFGIMMEAINRNSIYIDAGRYRLIINDTITAASLCPSELDFVYIDAAHDYESVCSDIAHWAPKVKRGGLICGHDYGKESGVKEAVDEFCGVVKNSARVTPCSSWWIIKP